MNQDSGLLFIAGFPGGGTDLIKNILNAHPDIHICGEMPFIYFLYKYGYSADTIFYSDEEVSKLRKLVLKLDRWKNFENMNAVSRTYPITIQEILRCWFTNKDVKVWGNKTPQNSENISGLIRIFPYAKLLIIVRDARDVSLSWKKKWGKDTFLCSHKWNKRIKKMITHLSIIDNNQYKIIFYESLITNPEMETIEICKFLKIPWSENMLNCHLYAENIIDGKINYGKKILPSNYNKWEKELSIYKIKRIEEISFDLLEYFSYQKKFAQISKPLTLKEGCFGLINDIRSSFFFGNKFSNNNSFSQRVIDVTHQIRHFYRKIK
ncbi:hypothetical protein BH20BAC1_BH20BAC1_13420 [soil metagenome]